jgi:Replication factor-A C terminal domain.
MDIRERLAHISDIPFKKSGRDVLTFIVVNTIREVNTGITAKRKKLNITDGEAQFDKAILCRQVDLGLQIRIDIGWLINILEWTISYDDVGVFYLMILRAEAEPNDQGREIAESFLEKSITHEALVGNLQINKIPNVKIADLNQWNYQSVRLRVIIKSKSLLRTCAKINWSCLNETKFFMMTVSDDSGSISAKVMVSDEPRLKKSERDFYEFFQVNQIYDITDFNYTEYESKNGSGLMDKILIINRDTRAEVIKETFSIVKNERDRRPKISSSTSTYGTRIYSVGEFLNEYISSEVTVVGIMVECTKAEPITVKNRNEVTLQRKIIFIDSDYLAVEMILWGRNAEVTLPPLGSVVLIYSASKKIWGDQTQLQAKPSNIKSNLREIPQYLALQKWRDERIDEGIPYTHPSKYVRDKKRILYREGDSFLSITLSRWESQKKAVEVTSSSKSPEEIDKMDVEPSSAFIGKASTTSVIPMTIEKLKHEAPLEPEKQAIVYTKIINLIKNRQSDKTNVWLYGRVTKIEYSQNETTYPSFWYYACSSCYKKAQLKKDLRDDIYYACPSCDIDKIETPVCKYYFKIVVEDDTGSLKLILFDNAGIQFFGITADQYKNRCILMSHFHEYYSALENKTFQFKIFKIEKNHQGCNVITWIVKNCKRL